MNCPRCDVKTRYGPRVIESAYDSENKEYYRRCKCSNCGAEWFSIEYEVEDNETLQAKFGAAAFSPADKRASSKRRFDDYRAFKARVQKDKRKQCK